MRTLKVRGEAKLSLARMGQSAVGSLVQALKDGDDLGRAEAAEALGEIGNTQGIAPLIEAFKADDAKVQHNAVLSLMKLNKTSGVEAFLELLGSESSEVRADAAWALGQTGDPRAKSRLLKTMNEDKDSLVRLNAGKALRQLSEKWEPVALEF